MMTWSRKSAIRWKSGVRSLLPQPVEAQLPRGVGGMGGVRGGYGRSVDESGEHEQRGHGRGVVLAEANDRVVEQRAREIRSEGGVDGVQLGGNFCDGRDEDDDASDQLDGLGDRLVVVAAPDRVAQVGQHRGQAARRGARGVERGRELGVCRQQIVGELDAETLEELEDLVGRERVVERRQHLRYRAGDRRERSGLALHRQPPIASPARSRARCCM
jgi:hypothetical protein